MGMPTTTVEVAFGTDPGATPVWTDISPYLQGPITVHRGRPDELSAFGAGTATIVLANEDRRFDPTIGAAAQWIDLPGTSGNYASTPDSAAVSITGDIDIRVKVALDDWTPAAEQALVAKWTNPSSRSYLFSVLTTGALRLRLTTDGSTSVIADSSVATGVTDGAIKWVRVTWVDATNVIAFFTSDDGVTWSQLGSTGSINIAGIADTTAALEVGTFSSGSGLLAGNVFYAEIRNGIDGPVVAKFDANTVPQTGTRTPASWTSATGEVWTVNGTAWAWGGSWGSPYWPNVVPMRRIRIRATYNAVTYDIFNGYVDSWEQQYQHPQSATCVVSATDVFKVLANVELPASVYMAEVLDDDPVALWRLDEPIGSTTVADATVNGYTMVTDGSPSFGAAGLAVRDPGSAMTIDADSEGVYRENRFILTGGPLTMEVLYQHTPSATHGRIMGMGSFDDRSNAYFNTGVSGTLNGFIGNDAAVAIPTSTGHNILDGAMHHIVMVWNSDNTIKFYVDGVDRTSGAPSLAVTSFVSTIGRNFVGHGLTATVSYGTYQFAAFYNYALSAARIAAHNTAARTPWKNDDSGTRLVRIFSLTGIAADFEIDPGVTILQSADLGGTALAAAQKIEETEFGALFVTGDGTVRFLGRDSLLKAPYTTSQGTFGDTGSDLEYGDLTFEYDDRLIVNEAQVSRLEGTMQVASDSASQTKYLRRTKVVDGLLHQDDSTSRDAAHWLVAHYKDPQLRVTGLRLEPSAGNEATHFPHVLGRELMDRVTVKRIPQNLGVTISQETMIQGITHTVTAMEWVTTWNLSPAETQDYWILGVVGSSELGETTRLGF